MFGLRVASGPEKLRGRLWSLKLIKAALSASASIPSLYRRISPVGNPNDSIVPILDQWIQEGQLATPGKLRGIVKELQAFKRYKHALELSYWMCDKGLVSLSASDVAARLNLILHVHSIDDAENYFKSLPQKLQAYSVDIALLNCYAHARCVEKAEAFMQNMRSMGLARTVLGYNILMNLYYHTENWEKIDMLMREMEEKGVCCDNFTYSIRLSAYSTVSNIKGMDLIMARMESDPNTVMDCATYMVAASGYLKAGSVEKALENGLKLRLLLATSTKKNIYYDFLLKLYAETGKKDDLHWMWKAYKKGMKIFNKGYMNMISSLLKLDDLNGAESIFEEWDSRKLSYDFRIPNLLIDVYCRKGRLEKAKAIINRGIEKGGAPNAYTWCYLASGYIEENLMSNSVEALKKAISVCASESKPSKETLATCLLHLEGNGDAETADEFVRALKIQGVFSDAACNRVLSCIKDGRVLSDVVD